ncbi:hypothetical protein F7725_011169 [Dissostichus mawsoni]|uniref:Transmembrane protein 14C n=1 Tax=Dissostichus mawsoni TaxID=36200 RepID=A0A7J5ZC99_DISMA|nr:hypothetical protein F7725_011169 [Dissostichus mawsoni]
MSAGLLFGLLAAVGAFLASQNPKNVWLSLGTSGTLAVVMGLRFLNSWKFMPAGLMTLASRPVRAPAAGSSSSVKSSTLRRWIQRSEDSEIGSSTLRALVDHHEREETNENFYMKIRRSNRQLGPSAAPSFRELMVGFLEMETPASASSPSSQLSSDLLAACPQRLRPVLTALMLFSAPKLQFVDTYSLIAHWLPVFHQAEGFLLSLCQRGRTHRLFWVLLHVVLREKYLLKRLVQKTGCISGMSLISVIASLLAFGIRDLRLVGTHFGKRKFIEILKISSTSLFPGNRGLRVYSSAMMHPTAQMSMGEL